MKAEFVTGLMTSILSHTVLSNSNTNLREFLIPMYLFCNNHRTYKTVRSETHIKIDVYKDVYHSFSICYEYVGEQEVLLEILSGVKLSRLKKVHILQFGSVLEDTLSTFRTLGHLNLGHCDSDAPRFDGK